MATADKVLACGDCMGAFLFSKEEQEAYAAEGRTRAPWRCPDCRLSHERVQAARAAMPVVPSRRRY